MAVSEVIELNIYWDRVNGTFDVQQGDNEDDPEVHVVMMDDEGLVFDSADWPGFRPS